MFHLIKRDDNKIIYFPALNKIFNITEKEYEKDFKEWEEKEIKAEQTLDSNLLNTINKYEQISNLQRLVIGVTNKCNFQCLYCYGINGSYGKKIQTISENKLFSLLDFFIVKSVDINQIQFFGGEPLIEFNLIKKICNYFEKAKMKNKIKDIPMMTMVTNGSIISEKIIKFFKEYNFSITVSLDGPPEVNDLARKDKNGDGTFKKISDTINLLRENDIQYGIEATYTKYHIKLGISVWNLIQFFYETFGLTSVHIPPVSSNNPNIALFPEYTKETMKIYREAINNCLRNWINGNIVSFSFLDRYLYGLIKLKTSITFCPAGYDTIAISWEGKIYPCFMFYGIDSFGYKENILEEQKIDFQMPLKSECTDCSKCWIRYLCSICIGGVYFETGSICKIPVYLCEWQKGMIEEIIFNISNIQKNVDIWEKFVRNLKKQNAQNA